MKHFLLVIFVTGLLSCWQEEKYPKAADALDAGREFIDAFLDGDTQKAEFYMVKDDQNMSILNRMHKQLRRTSSEDQKGYKESSIIIGDIDNLSETEVIIYYQSSYDRTGRKIKVVQKNGEWLVDLKYTFNPNM